jgi:hypothetical protein
MDGLIDPDRPVWANAIGSETTAQRIQWRGRRSHMTIPARIKSLFGLLASESRRVEGIGHAVSPIGPCRQDS